MGGLRRPLPFAFWTFLIAGASLAGVPVVTAGFYSKDWILDAAWSSPAGGRWLWLAGIAGALLTAVYIFRVVFLVFFGAQKKAPTVERRARVLVPLVILAVLSVVGGLVEVPRTLGHLPAFSTWMQSTLPAVREGGVGTEAILEAIAALAAFGGIAIAWALYLAHPRLLAALMNAPSARTLATFWSRGWGFDAVYDLFVVRPYKWFARVDQKDVLDAPTFAIAAVAGALNRGLARTENGRLRWYAAGIAAGSVILAAIVLFT
jgi:NADH-quinone oxidoreductase subunit L